ncbi:MAG: MarR family transcriptional regulator [Sphaerochaeta sp.]|jgi:DNA-binding MarR family transcriptional regulator|nr:MarR family transcriptional regulator [Sphaerochaeta sp.]
MVDFCALRRLIVDLQKIEDDIQRKYQLTFMQASLLCALEHGYEDGKSIACQMRLSPSRMTRLLDVLEQKKLVVRSSSPVDRRNNVVSITEEGEKALSLIKSSDVAIPAYINQMLTKGETE